MALFLFFFLHFTSEARVFDMGKETFGTYLKANYQSAVPGQDPFVNSSGANLSFDGRHRYSMGYEFGFLFASRYLNWRMGVEVLQPPDQKGIAASNAAGTTLYTLESALSALILKGAFEGNVVTWRNSRVSIVAEGGYASLTLQNTYAFQAAGTTAFGLADFREEVKGSTAMLGGGFLFETLMSDTTTFFVEAGYRAMNFTTLNHSVASIGFQGSVAKGDAARTDTGTARTLNLSGLSASAGFRFWIF